MNIPRWQLFLATLVTLLNPQDTFAEDWPMFGRDGTRNAVSTEAAAPLRWNIEERNETQVTLASNGIRWAARLGSQTHSSPVVSGGLVWIGTNSNRPGDNFQGLNSVLKCFRVADGKQVYEYVSPRLQIQSADRGWTGLGSSPLIEGDRLWLMTNRSEVLCMDIGPLLRDQGPPRELWKLDLIKAFDVFVHVPLMGPPPTCSIGPSWNGRIFVTINNGIDDSRTKVPRPDAPSLVCLNKGNGEVLWKDNSPGANILLTQSSSPTVAEIAGRVQVIVPEGDGWVRAFDPESGEKLWEFDINPKTAHYNSRVSSRNSILGNAVVYEDRVYLASGRDAEHGEGPGRLVCIDPTKRGDISSELAVDANDQPLPRRRLQAVDPKVGEKVIPNPNSALNWEFVSCGKAFEDKMHRTMSSVAISKGLVIAADMAGLVHCLDAKSGKRHWSFDMSASIWCSPLIVDDKIYVADEDGEMAIFGLNADPNVAIQKNIGIDEPLNTIAMQQSILSSPSFANGVLYLATRSTLFAIGADEQNELEPKKTGGYWPQWRGPNRNNISTETGLLKVWPEGGPPLISRMEGVGEGIATVSIADNRIFTLGYFEKDEFVTAIDQTTGERVWATRIGPRELPESTLMRLLSQRSPTVDDDRLYAFTSSGRLVCLQTGNGEEVWSKNYPDDFGAPQPQWRFCDYPLVDGDKLVCTPGGPQASIVALDKLTGRELWRSLVPEGGRAAYAALVVSEACGVKQYVAFLEKGVVGLRASDGRLLWRSQKPSNGIANSHTPIISGDQILAGNGYQGGIVLLTLSGSDDKIEPHEQYFEPLVLDPFHDASTLIGDHLYSFTMAGVPSCLNWKTGKTVWSGKRMVGHGKAAATFADGRLYVRQSDGRVTLVDASPEGLIEFGHFGIPDHAESTGSTFPVIAGGRLYLRDENNLFCYNIRADVLKHPIADLKTIVLNAPTPIAEAEPKERTLRSVYVPTPEDIVEKMLELAAIKKSDVVYDLGSGDGRIVIASAAKYGCHAVGYELDKELVESSRAKIKEANLAEMATIEHKDLFSADLTKADVIMVYLLPAQLKKLLPQLKTMKPGARIVSHQFEIPGCPADLMVKSESTDDGVKHSLYVWKLPLKIEIESE